MRLSIGLGAGWVAGSEYGQIVARVGEAGMGESRLVYECVHRHEILADDGSFYGEIPEYNEVYANAVALEDCREQ
jgi:hypothetical protein